MAVRTSWLLFLAVAVLSVGCSTTSVPPGEGPEICDNGADDNADEKVDCLDPKCFSDALCQVKQENCTNAVDDSDDGLIDCADPMCAGQSCGADCLCLNGMKVMGTGGGAGGGGGSTGGGSGGGSTGGGSGGGGATGGGSGGGGTTGGGGGSTGGGAGGGGGGGTCTGCGAGCVCNGGVKAEVDCADNGDNDTDNLTDCEDPDCAGITCGLGCSCVNSARKETNCTDGSDNDVDGLRDCLDPDCTGAATEVCNDGIDNTCDRAIDCGDSKCSGDAACANLDDGKPCLADGQCAGGDCSDEATYGNPNGACTNAVSCTPGTNAGCHGGHCFEGTSFNRCHAACTGAGVVGTGACRAGYACLDPDYDTFNDNSGCLSLCTSNSECAGSGSGYGCNPWSKRCGNQDQGLGKYGAACTTSAQCESNFCFTGDANPGGYCTGPCRGDTENCGPNGWCYFNPSLGDNYGICYQACGTGTECRQAENYQCRQTSSGSPDYICACLPADEFCSFNGECCSGSCTNFFGIFTCD